MGWEYGHIYNEREMMNEEGIVVLSLFDGISCGRVALERAGIKVKAYYASEIDKHAIKVSKDNWCDIAHIGDVTKVFYKGGILTTENGDIDIGKVDLVLAGSPCQGFSMAGKQLAFEDERSKLYFKFESLFADVKQHNPEAKFLLENVKMKQEHKDFISQRLGVEPIAINSNLVSAQNRYRLYWTNIQGVKQPEDKGITLEDILIDEIDEKYFVKTGRLSWLQKFGEVKEKDGYVAFNPEKAKCLTVRGEPSWNTTYILQWPHGGNPGGYRAEGGKTPTLTTSSWEANNLLLHEGSVRKLSPVECERLQTLTDGYTKVVSDSQRYKALGNGWTADVIAHVLKGLNK
jgi:DNA (cytosine-5)-methyltransferase 3A